MLLCGVFLVPAALLGAEEPAAREPALTRIESPRPSGGFEAPLDWVLRRLSAREDGWEGEKIHEEILVALHRFEDLLRGREFKLEAWMGLVTDSLRADPLRGEEVSVFSGPLASAWRRRGDGGEKPASGPAAFIEALGRFVAPLERIDKAKFKVFRIEPRPEAPKPGPPRPELPRSAATEVLLELDGPGSSGSGPFERTAKRVQLRAIWGIEWIESTGRWGIAAIHVRSAERTEMTARPFTDVSERQLGAVASYREQLIRGVDHWRTRIDSASEIEIYGHQGIAIGDVDGDGREDFYIAQPAGLPNRLFRATDSGFEDISAPAGVDVLDESGGPLLVDLDSDGDPDLLVVTPTELLLLENLGGARFRRRAGTGLEAAASGRASMMGAAAADYDLDGDVDLFIISYVFWAGASSKVASVYPFPYHDANNGAPNFLFRNDGGLRFTDVTVPSGMDVRNRRFSLAASWCDADRDGDPDLYVANDFGKNNYYRNAGDGTFAEEAEALGIEDTGNGMSVAWADVDGDGHEDLYVGKMWSSAGSRLAAHVGFRRTQGGSPAVYARMAKGNSLFRNLGGGRFDDATDRAGVAFGRWAWSSQFFDFDGDGDEDLYVVNGFVSGEKLDDL